MSHVTTIEKFRKDNFVSWKLQIEAVLIKNHHWDCGNSKEIKPAEGSAEEKKQLQDDQKVRADVNRAIYPSGLCHINHYLTLSAIWNKLKDVYESREPAKKVTVLKQRLFRKMSMNEMMSEHLNIFLKQLIN